MFMHVYTNMSECLGLHAKEICLCIFIFAHALDSMKSTKINVTQKLQTLQNGRCGFLHLCRQYFA